MDACPVPGPVVSVYLLPHLTLPSAPRRNNYHHTEMDTLCQMSQQTQIALYGARCTVFTQSTDVWWMRQFTSTQTCNKFSGSDKCHEEKIKQGEGTQNGGIGCQFRWGRQGRPPRGGDISGERSEEVNQESIAKATPIMPHTRAPHTRDT